MILYLKSCVMCARELVVFKMPCLFGAMWGGGDATKVFRDARQETATIPGNDPSPKPMESRWGDCGENNRNSETEYDRNSTSNNKSNDNSAAVAQTRMLTTVTAAEQEEWE